MILTEEQRAALKRVVAYMDEMYAIASPYHGCTEDANILRAMIDSSDHIVEPDELIGFDLERARGLRDFLQDDCAEVGDVWAEMIAEIERLRAENEELQESLTEAYLLGSHKKAKELAPRIKELESLVESSMSLVVGPGARPPCWQITEERRGAIDRAMRVLGWAEHAGKTQDVHVATDVSVLRAMLREAAFREYQAEAGL